MGSRRAGSAHAVWRAPPDLAPVVHAGGVAPLGRFSGAPEGDKLISDLSARGNPRVRLARDQCIPPGALLTGGLGKAKI